MKYFTLTAAKGRDKERSCALIDAANIEDAALRARRLKDEGFLSFVKPGSTYAIRASSRRETDLLQKFLNACNGAEARIHLQSDFDGLLARRQSLMLSFFMGLYLAPDKVRTIANGGIATSTPKTTATAPSGSGGVEQSAAPKDDVLEDSAQEAAVEASEDAVGMDQPEGAALSGEDAPIDNSSQDDMLASILNGAESPASGGDQPIDLGDDEVL